MQYTVVDVYELYLGRRDGGWAKSSEASFVKDVRETRLAVDDAPARQPAPALVSFRTRVPNVRSSVSQSSVAILSRWLDSVDFESTGD